MRTMTVPLRWPGEIALIARLWLAIGDTDYGWLQWGEAGWKEVGRCDFMRMTGIISSLVDSSQGM